MLQEWSKIDGQNPNFAWELGISDSANLNLLKKDGSQILPKNVPNTLLRAFLRNPTSLQSNCSFVVLVPCVFACELCTYMILCQNRLSCTVRYAADGRYCFYSGVYLSVFAPQRRQV